MIGMSTGGMIIMIQAVRKLHNMNIARIVIRIFHHLGKMAAKNIKEVVIKITKTDQTTKKFTSQKHQANFNMIRREKNKISITIDVHNMNREKPAVHPFLIAIFAGRMDIMQINVQCSTKAQRKSTCC